jgi:NAD(P)-dependent dehydrogenase (short-subunit alcohol dehydrogenase family)
LIEPAHLSLLLQRDCIYVQADRGMNMAKSKTVLITGASSGIGKSTALYFQQQGWNATMRDPEHGKELRALDQVLVTSLDVTNSDSIQQAVNTGLERLQSIGVLVNNAGFGAYGPLEATGMETVRRQFVPMSFVCWRPQRRCCRTSAPSTPA